MEATTIAAIASPPGAGQRGIVRLSGPAAARIISACCRVGDVPLAPGARAVHEGRFDDGRGEQPVRVLWMPAPRSFTREDVAELHLPGAPPLLRAALARVLELGAEPARPGEFTERAFRSGRIDLSRAQGVLALVSARTQAERRAASALVGGGLDRRVAELRELLLGLRTLVEASLDFDELDTGHVPEAEIEELLARTRAVFEASTAWERARTDGMGLPPVVLRGAPNAGKSSLYNALLGSERALVGEQAGTTRDVLRARLEVAGQAFLLHDTAGLDPEASGLAARAQERGEAAARSADLELWVVDALRGGPPPGPRGEDEGGERLLVWSQIDRPAVSATPPKGLQALEPAWVAVSARTGVGLEQLRVEIARLLARVGAGGLARELDWALRRALEGARGELEAAAAAFHAALPLDLVAEGLRRALEALDRIDGRSTPEDVLTRIFARFCLGK